MAILSDLTGQRFGLWFVVKRSENNWRGCARWECLCECGSIKIIDGGSLTTGNSKSCGCYQKDIKGRKFNRWTAVKKVGVNKRGNSVWECVCECGNVRNIERSSLITGNSKSCGCYQKELLRETKIKLNTTHGKSRTKAHTIWKSMKGRCYNPNNKKYPIYGGRGIKVCAKWLNSFEAFFEDMGEPPEDLTLDRIDVNGDYSPENCRWATLVEQANNRRDNVCYTYQGRTLTVAEWAREVGKAGSTIHSRLRRGWSFEKSITTPVRRQK